MELLIPDFDADPQQLAVVFAARPEVLAHNIETVPRIFRRIRPGFRYERSLEVLSRARAAGLITKSNLILGLGEERDEVSAAMADLRAAGCDLLTITQYLRPSLRHHPIDRWVPPEEFDELGEEAAELGFAGVMAGPLVRSSYRAGSGWHRKVGFRRSRASRDGRPWPARADGIARWDSGEAGPAATAGLGRPERMARGGVLGGRPPRANTVSSRA